MLADSCSLQIFGWVPLHQFLSNVSSVRFWYACCYTCFRLWDFPFLHLHGFWPVTSLLALHISTVPQLNSWKITPCSALLNFSGPAGSLPPRFLILLWWFRWMVFGCYIISGHFERQPKSLSMSRIGKVRLAGTCWRGCWAHGIAFENCLKMFVASDCSNCK